MRTMRTLLTVALAAGFATTGLAVANAQQRGGEFRQAQGREDRGFGGRVQPVGPARYEGGRDFDRGNRDRRDGDRGGYVNYGGGYAAPVYGGGVDVAYVPPCPGPGYAWTAGYWDGGVWMPGTWVFQGNPGVVVGVGYGGYYGGRGYVGRGYVGRGYDARGFDRGHVVARGFVGERGHFGRR